MEEIRDYSLIAGFIALTVLALLTLVIVSAIGYLSLRLLSALTRFMEGRVAPGLTGACARLEETSKGGPALIFDLALLGLGAFQRVRAAWQPKPKPRDHSGFPFFSR